MEKYKVVSETGIVLEGSDTVYPTDDVLELDSENDQVKALIESGAIVAFDDEESEEDEEQETAEEVAPEAPAHEEDEEQETAETAPGERHPLA